MTWALAAEMMTPDTRCLDLWMLIACEVDIAELPALKTSLARQIGDRLPL